MIYDIVEPIYFGVGGYERVEWRPTGLSMRAYDDDQAMALAKQLVGGSPVLQLIGNRRSREDE